MKFLAIGGVLAFVIAFCVLHLYLELDVAIAGILSAFVSIGAMFVVDQGGRHRR